MTNFQHTILEASNSDLITFQEASAMLTMYESDSLMTKIKNAWESLKKWVKSVVKKLIEKVTGIKIKEKKKVRLPFNLNTVKKNLEKILDHLKPDADFNDSFWNKFKTKTGFFTESYPVRPLEKQQADGTYCDIMNDEAYGAMALINSLLLKISDRLNQFELDHVDSQKISTIRSIVSTVNSIIYTAARILNTDSYKYDADYSQDFNDKGKELIEYNKLKDNLDNAKKALESMELDDPNWDKIQMDYKKANDAFSDFLMHMKSASPSEDRDKIIYTSGSYFVKTSLSVMRQQLVTIGKMINSKKINWKDDNQDVVDVYRGTVAYANEAFNDAVKNIELVKSVYTAQYDSNIVADERNERWFKDVGHTVKDLQTRRDNLMKLAKSRGLI